MSNPNKFEDFFMKLREVTPFPIAEFLEEAKQKQKLSSNKLACVHLILEHKCFATLPSTNIQQSITLLYHVLYHFSSVGVMFGYLNSFNWIWLSFST